MASRRPKNRVSLYDELLNHLEGIYFQIPVMSFIDRHCSIFDPHQEDNIEYRKVWAAYKSLITQLLESFREDNGLTHDQIIKALAEMDKLSDIHELYKGLFAQVFATESFEVFKNMMIQKNIELQQQLLLIILSQSGYVPAVLVQDSSAPVQQQQQPQRAPQRAPPPAQYHPPSGGPAGPSVQGSAPPGSDKPSSEEAVLAAVIRQSQKDHEASERRRAEKDEAMVAKAIIMSKQEASRLEQEHQEQEMRLSRAVHDIALTDPPPMKAPPAAAGPQRQAPEAASRPAKPAAGGSPSKSPMKAPPPQQSPVKEFSLGATASVVSGEQAAAAWLSSAISDASQDPTLRQFTHGSGDLSAEEMKKRQEFLKQQRDKLIQMKAKEREKQLKDAEKANPGRPSSARAARNALKDDGDTKKVDDKTLAMRRAIADKLKAEVIAESGKIE